jgi:hypothetical protein
MSSLTILMSPLEPSTVQREFHFVPEFNDDSGKMVLFLHPKTEAVPCIMFSLGLREDFENSIFGVLHGDLMPAPVWERTTYTTRQFGSDTVKVKDSITIYVENPTGNIEAIPYWYKTIIEAINPKNIAPHYPFIASYGKQAPEAIGPKSGEDWLYELPMSFRHEETQPIPVPGEYIRARWCLNIKEKYFEAVKYVKYETPLLTGGWILSKQGEGEETTYTVEIYGQEVSGIKPTDYFDYMAGMSSQRWVYLIKMNATMEDAPRQAYGSSQIKEVSKSGSEYRIVPFNFYGPMNTDCAVPSEKAIKIDSSVNFSEVFDMKKYEGEIISVDHENNTGVVDVVGGSLHTLPIFYYCEGAESIKGGSKAFTEGDICLIEKPYGSWDDAKVVGFRDEIKPCIETFYIRFTFNGYNPINGGEKVRIQFPDDPELNYSQLFRLPLDTEDGLNLVGPFILSDDKELGLSLDCEFAFLDNEYDWPSSYFFHYYEQTTAEDPEKTHSSFVEEVIHTSSYYPGGSLTQLNPKFSEASDAKDTHYWKKIRHILSVNNLKNATMTKEEINGQEFPVFTINWEIYGIEIINTLQLGFSKLGSDCGVDDLMAANEVNVGSFVITSAQPNEIGYSEYDCDFSRADQICKTWEALRGLNSQSGMTADNLCIRVDSEGNILPFTPIEINIEMHSKNVHVFHWYNDPVDGYMWDYDICQTNMDDWRSDGVVLTNKWLGVGLLPEGNF